MMKTYEDLEGRILPSNIFYCSSFKKATKIDEIFTIDLTLCSKCQIDGGDLSFFVAIWENTNFKTTFPLF